MVAQLVTSRLVLSSIELDITYITSLQEPVLVSVLGQMDLILNFKPSFFKLQFINIFPSTPMSMELFFSFPFYG
jgi:hypothetical protein